MNNPPPDGRPVSVSSQLTHSSQKFTHISAAELFNDKGYRLCKATHGVSRGRWYFECTVQPPKTPDGNLRIGWSQINGDLQAPCGYDQFSYGIRLSPLTLFHCSRKQSPISATFGDIEETEIDCGQPGTVVGLCISLPDIDPQVWFTPKHALLIDADGMPTEPLPLPWNGEERYDTVAYYGNRPIVKQSEIRLLVNGKDYGVMFQDLYAGKYYPAFSSYMGGCVSVNFGSDPFKYAPPEGYRAFSECALGDPCHDPVFTKTDINKQTPL